MSAFHGRPYIGIMFECCRVYDRIYRNRDGTAYEGQCPRCYRRFKVKIASWGISQRFFRGT
jgi:hypothetical protein